MDFKVGDVVVCVDASPPRDVSNPRTLTNGRVYRVSRLVPCLEGDGLLVDGEKPLMCTVTKAPAGWAPSRFRHIRAADEQFAQQMRALRPVRGKQDA